MEETFILSKFDQLVESGSAVYDPRQKIVEYVDGELKFQFCLTSALARKPTFQKPQSHADQNTAEPQKKLRDGSDIDTTGFEIGDISNTHFLAVNKFCYARPHLMLLTADAHQRQHEPLREDDFKAAWATLTAAGEKYVVFFNCGRDGGCSRLHKHLQLMPTPANNFAEFLDSKDSIEPDVPFQWFYHRFEKSQELKSVSLFQIYDELLRRATVVGGGLSEHAATLPPGSACPHNMILTNRWMVVIPRRRGAVNEEAGINAIGMLGFIAVATEKEINSLVRLGLTKSLKEVGFPKSP